MDRRTICDLPVSSYVLLPGKHLQPVAIKWKGRITNGKMMACAGINRRKWPNTLPRPGHTIVCPTGPCLPVMHIRTWATMPRITNQTVPFCRLHRFHRHNGNKLLPLSYGHLNSIPTKNWNATFLPSSV